MGVVIGVFVIPPKVPSGIAPTSVVDSAPANEVRTVDEQPATLRVTAAAAQTLTAPMSGTVTSTSCRSGETAASGGGALSVNDDVLVYLATSRPLWRDLGVGDSGADVRSLQEELAALGKGIRPDGRFGTATLRAAIEVAERAGATDASTWSSLPHSRLIWLPASTVQTATCDVDLGDRVTEGDAVATLPRGVSEARVTPLPLNAMSGEREAVVGDLTLRLDGSGAIGAVEDLARLAQSSEYRQHVEGAAAVGPTGSGAPPEDSAGSGMSIVYRLTAPISVFSVPAAAVYGADRASACVLSDDHAVAVTIVGSQLGQTFIVPADGRKLRMVRLDTRNAPACR